MVGASLFMAFLIWPKGTTTQTTEVANKTGEKGLWHRFVMGVFDSGLLGIMGLFMAILLPLVLIGFLVELGNIFLDYLKGG